MSPQLPRAPACWHRYQPAGLTGRQLPHCFPSCDRSAGDLTRAICPRPLPAGYLRGQLQSVTRWDATARPVRVHRASGIVAGPAVHCPLSSVHCPASCVCNWRYCSSAPFRWWTRGRAAAGAGGFNSTVHRYAVTRDGERYVTERPVGWPADNVVIMAVYGTAAASWTLGAVGTAAVCKGRSQVSVGSSAAPTRIHG